MWWALLLVGGVLSKPLGENADIAWTYHPSDGPGGLRSWTKNFPECKGPNQSPVILPTVIDFHPFLERLEYHNLDACDLEMFNDGKVVTIRCKPNSKGERLSLKGGVFGKDSFLWDRVVIRVGMDRDVGSEHGMNGVMYSGEIQCFYFSSQFKSFEEAVAKPGAVAIISTIIESVDEETPMLNNICASLSMISGSKNVVRLEAEAAAELAAMWAPVFEGEGKEKVCINCDYYFYEGSLSHPPCNEVAFWYVYMHTLKVSETQLQKLRDVISWETKKPLMCNYRYPQPLNFREVLQHRENNLDAYNLPPPPPYPPQGGDYPFPPHPMHEFPYPPPPPYGGEQCKEGDVECLKAQQFLMQQMAGMSGMAGMAGMEDSYLASDPEKDGSDSSNGRYDNWPGNDDYQNSNSYQRGGPQYPPPPPPPSQRYPPHQPPQYPPQQGNRQQHPHQAPYPPQQYPPHTEREQRLFGFPYFPGFGDFGFPDFNFDLTNTVNTDMLADWQSQIGGGGGGGGGDDEGSGGDGEGEEEGEDSK